MRFLVAIRREPEAGDPVDWLAFDQFQRTWTAILESDRVRVWASEETSVFAAHNVPSVDGRMCIIGRIFEEGPSAINWKGVHRCWGAFIAVAVEANGRVVRVYRDPTGRIECWRVKYAGFDVLFSHLEDVLPLIGRLLTVNWNYLAFHLTNRWLHNEQTGYREIFELLPGDELTYDCDKVSIARKWHPASFIAEPHCTIEDARSAMRDAAERAVSNWATLYRSILVDLSGGLDSAIVLGLLRRHACHPDVVGVNYVIKHVEGDEREYANDAARLHAISVVERDPAEGLKEPSPPFSLRLLRPATRTFPLGYDSVGISTQKAFKRDAFFSGTGGDHIFYDHLTTTASVDHYRVRGFGGLLEKAHLLAQISRSTIWSGIGAVYADIRSTDGDAVQALMRKCGRYFAKNPFLSDGAINSMNFEHFVHPVVLDLSKSATPSRLVQVINLIELQKHYWRYGRADESDETHPLFSQPLFEASLQTPCHWFCAGGIQRGLARQTFSDLLPESILTRKFKSSNSSHWLKAISRELPWFRALMLDGALAGSGLLKKDDLESTTRAEGLLQSANFPQYLNTVSVAQWVERALEIQ